MHTWCISPLTSFAIAIFLHILLHVHMFITTTDTQGLSAIPLHVHVHVQSCMYYVHVYYIIFYIHVRAIMLLSAKTQGSCMSADLINGHAMQEHIHVLWKQDTSKYHVCVLSTPEIKTPP